MSPSLSLPIRAQCHPHKTVGCRTQGVLAQWGEGPESRPPKSSHTQTFSVSLFPAKNMILQICLTHGKPYSPAGQTKCGVSKIPTQRCILLGTKVGDGWWILVGWLYGLCITGRVVQECRSCIHMSAGSKAGARVAFNFEKVCVHTSTFLQCAL